MARPVAWTFLVYFVELRVVGTRAAVNIGAQTDRGVPWAAQRGSARFWQRTLWDLGGLAGGLDVDEVPGVLSAYRDA